MIFFRDIRWERGAGSTTGVARVEKPNQNPTRQNLKIMENRQVLALFPALSIRKLFCVLEIYFLTISDRFAGVLPRIVDGKLPWTIQNPFGTAMGRHGSLGRLYSPELDFGQIFGFSPTLVTSCTAVVRSCAILSRGTAV